MAIFFRALLGILGSAQTSGIRVCVFYKIPRWWPRTFQPEKHGFKEPRESVT